MRFIYLFIVLVVVGCENNRIGNLEVVRIDGGLEGLTFDEAQERCERLGNEWRLPTIEELELIYENRFDIDGIEFDIDGIDDGHFFGTFWSTTNCDEYLWEHQTQLKLFWDGNTLCNPIINNGDTLEYNALAVREIQ